jgi:hypothetical protein
MVATYTSGGETMKFERAMFEFHGFSRAEGIGSGNAHASAQATS